MSNDWSASLVLLILFAAAGQINSQTHTVTVEVRDCTPGEGVLKISVYDSSASFLAEGFRQKQSDLEQGGGTSFVFEGIPVGMYAIAIIQDMNHNGSLDMGMFGPKEPYGFSNNARGLFGPPSFEEARFTLDGDREMCIVLR